MTAGVTAIIYPVKDLAKAKALFRVVSGMEPEMDAPYYVGFNVAGVDIGLDPNGHSQGMTGPVCYWNVDDIKASLGALLDAGAQPVQEIKDVGGGKLIAWVKDADGNAIGLIQPAR